MISIVLIALLTALLCIFGMVKWYSTLFSDGRGKLGNQVVFSNWKGRPYMRAYAIPANPNTLKQQAQRAVHSAGVSGYQTYVGNDTERKGTWNNQALPRQISGFNLFMKYVDEIDISCEKDQPEADQVTITYTIPSDVAGMALYRQAAAVLTEIAAPGELTAGVGQEFVDTSPNTSVENYYYIAPGAIYDNLTGDDQQAVRCAHWTPNESTGATDPCIADYS